MAKKKLSDEQKLKNKVVQNITSKKNFLDKSDNREVKDTFLEKFILCEIGLKTVLNYYYKYQGQEKEATDIEMGLSTIKAALKLVQYNIPDDTLERMFKAKKKRGERSVRDLRNGIVHDLTIPDLQEVIARKDELFGLMDEFVAALTTSKNN